VWAWVTLVAALATGCDDGTQQSCGSDPCPLLTNCNPQTGRCEAPDDVPASRVDSNPSLAIDGEGRVMVAARNTADGELVFGLWDDAAGEFRYQRVDATGDVGHDPSLAVFPDGRPGIVHVDTLNEQLKFAFYNEQGVWQSEVIDQTRASATDLTIDVDGAPHVSYRDESTRNLRYATRRDRVWRIQNVDLANDTAERIPPEEACPPEQRDRIDVGVGLDSHIALQGSTPVISYHDADCGTLRLARGGGDARWTLRVVDGWSPDAFDGPRAAPRTQVGRFNDIGVGPFGRLSVAFFHGSHGELRVVDFSSGTPVIETADDGVRTVDDGPARKRIVGQAPSIAFDEQGRVIVSLAHERRRGRHRGPRP